MNDSDMDLAERVVWQLIGPAQKEDFLSRLPNRPDWQKAIDFVRELLKEHYPFGGGY